MAQKSLKDAQELQEYILKNVKPTGNILGSGSFGTVEQMQFDHALCAGKKIHKMLVDPSSIGSKRLAEKFEQECKLMKELRHPHVVQFMGLCFLEDSNLPVIVMELLDNNIDSWISSNAPRELLPLSLKSIILHDTAKGLAYLHNHNPVVIHRDLTARNVLLTSSMRAKIADLGNAYIAPPQHLTKTMTRVPGTIAYMPPEAFEHSGRYTVKLDVFSFGHLALYVMTQEEPCLHLLPATYPDPSNEDKAIGLTEIERRKHYFDMLSKQFASSHELTTLIRSCLNNNPQKRPSADQIVKCFDELLENHTDEYQAFAKLNKFDMAKKVNEAQYSRLMRTVSFEDKIQSGEHFILDFLKLKQGKKIKGRNWKKYAFRFQSPSLKCYGDINKDPVHATDSSKIESIVKSAEEENAFEIHFKGRGRDRWIVRTSSETETVAWMKVLQPEQHEQESYYDLPAAPSPPQEDLCDANTYETIPGFETKVAKQHGIAEYMPIDPAGLDNRFYAVSQVSTQKPKKPGVSKSLEEISTPDMKPHVPQITIEDDTDACQVVAAATPDGVEQRRSQLFSEEEMELLAKMLENVVLEDGTKIDVENLSTRIRGASFSCQKKSDIPEKSDTPQNEKEDLNEVWPQSDGSYVDPDVIDATYEQIPDQSPHYYCNIDAKPPVPPKSPRHGSVKRKPEPPPRKFNRLSVTRRGKSLDKFMSASSSVSADMLVLGSHSDDDDSDIYEPRPDWAKANVSVSSDKEVPEKFGPDDDDVLHLLSLDKKQIHNPKRFAEGQFGAVFKATYTSYGENVPVAIKTIKHETDADKEAFLKEMKVMSKMLHPNIVRLFGLVLEKNWIVLEYLSHGDLGNFLKKNPRGVRKLIKYMTDIAMGMHHISSLGLIHRDLAIRNVLVSQDEVCKVADFGLIRSVAGDGQYSFSGTSKIPIRWCAPETFVERVYYSASDVWSYGVVLWEMANPTKLPYHEFQDFEVGVQIRDGRYPDIPSEYPKTVKEIMLACFNVKPAKRPSFQYISILLSKERYML